MNNIAIRIVTWILALIFLLSGGAKLAGLEFEIEAFTRSDYPIWFMYVAGALEVAGGIALLMPRLRTLAAAGLATFMIGAVVTHVVHAEWAMLVVALAILLTAAWRAWVGASRSLTVHAQPFP